MQADVAGAQNAGSPYWYDRGVGSWDMAYQLPQGLTCDGVNTRCVMQWWYLTGEGSTGRWKVMELLIALGSGEMQGVAVCPSVAKVLPCTGDSIPITLPTLATPLRRRQLL